METQVLNEPTAHWLAKMGSRNIKVMNAHCKKNKQTKTDHTENNTLFCKYPSGCFKKIIVVKYA